MTNCIRIFVVLALLAGGWANAGIIASEEVQVVTRSFDPVDLELGPTDTDVGADNHVLVGPGGDLRVDGGSELRTGSFTQSGLGGGDSNVDIVGAGSRVVLTRAFVDGGQFGHDSAPDTQATMTIADGGALVIEDPDGLCATRGACFIGQIGNAAGTNVTVNVRGTESLLDTDIETAPQTTIIGDTSIFTQEEDGFDFGTPGGATNALVQITEGGRFETGDTWVARGREGPESVSATVVVDGASSAWEANSIGLGFHESDAAAPGTSGTIITSNDATISTVDGLFIGAGGVVGGNGTILGDVTNLGGVISPGLSPGRLSIGGDLYMESGTLRLEIGGTAPGTFDVLEVDGLLDLIGGEVVFELMDGFTVPDELVFPFLDVAGGINIGEAVNFEFSGFASDFDVDIDRSTGTFAAVRRSVTVSEPQSIALLAVSLVFVMGRWLKIRAGGGAGITAAASRRRCLRRPAAPLTSGSNRRALIGPTPAPNEEGP